MCMKNINVNTIFADIVTNPENGQVSLLNIGKPCRVTKEEGTRKIPQLSVAIFVGATQSKDEDVIEAINPDAVFSFRDKYELIVRLTETVSGAFKDLGRFEIDPESGDVYEGICRHTFNYTHLGIYQDISLPEEKEYERFVIKINIRRKIDNRQTEGWIVQTVVPIMFE